MIVCLLCFRRAKVLEKLQSNITSFFFNCLLVSTPVKAELAEDWSSSDYMDFSVSGGTLFNLLNMQCAELFLEFIPCFDNTLDSDQLSVIQDSHKDYVQVFS